MRWFYYSLSIVLLFAASTSPAHAQLTSPQIGWEAELSTIHHSVSGTVRILDEDTLLFDNFIYDGLGPAVYFYLGTENNDLAFAAGLEIGTLLTGTVYNGSQPSFEFDLVGQTLQG